MTEHEIFSGDYDHDLDFTFANGTAVMESCTASLNGEMWVFGGYEHNYQVSELLSK